jgi:hypothetical protein
MLPLPGWPHDSSTACLWRTRCILHRVLTSNMRSATIASFAAMLPVLPHQVASQFKHLCT